jgi:nucleotide-binding universal stress UspA family protein
MGRYKKILVAVDYSESSMHALRESFKLATKEQSWITVVSVVPPYEGDLATTVIGNIEKAIKEPFEKALTEAEKIAKAERVLIKTVCVEGEPYEGIVDIAAAEHCDLIVMGRKGLSRLERVLMGSVTAKVIGHTLCRVLVIPKDSKLTYEKILIATDGSMHSEFAAHEAIDIAKHSGSTLTVLSVAKKDENLPAAKECVDMVKKDAEKEGIKVEALIRKGVPHEVIVNTAAHEEVGLIVVGSHGRTGITKLLMGSVTERVIGNAKCAVLVWKL